MTCQEAKKTLENLIALKKKEVEDLKFGLKQPLVTTQRINNEIRKLEKVLDVLKGLDVEISFSELD